MRDVGMTMSDWLIHNAQVLDPVHGRVGTSLLVRDGRIAMVDPPDPPGDDAVPRIDGGGRLLTPGLIDLHVHGVERWLFEAGPDALVEGVAALARYGVTSVLPTFHQTLRPEKLDHLRALTEALGRCTSVDVPGFHLEGPFLKLPGAGALTMAGDLEYLEALLEATNGAVSAMSISPDVEGIIPVIERLVARGVVPFITHTQANVDQTVAAIEAGARHGTHFYDVFPPPEPTDPGVRPVGCVEALLAEPRVSVDFIADGIHVHPMAIRAALAAKGSANVIVITDANIGAGLGEGVHETHPGKYIRIRPGDAPRLHRPGEAGDGALAGSALTMDRAIDNLTRWLTLPEHEIWAMGTSSPASRMGWSRKGRIEVGADADVVLWDHTERTGLRSACTWVQGRCVYDGASICASRASA